MSEAMDISTRAGGAVGEEPLEHVAYVYDGSTEGLLSAVFEAYARHEHPQDVLREGLVQPRLDQSLRFVATDVDRALRVRAGIERSCGAREAEAVVHASLSDDAGAPAAVLRFVRYALPPRPQPPRPHTLRETAHPAVAELLSLERSVMNEREHLMQFLRFEHLQGDVWFARCSPKANVVPLLMGWFSARFNTQPFVIFDEAHDLAGVYEGRGWRLVRTTGVELPCKADDEELMSAAWRRFYEVVSVEARYNPELRRQLMPKRFWANLTEMQQQPPSVQIARTS